MYSYDVPVVVPLKRVKPALAQAVPDVAKWSVKKQTGQRRSKDPRPLYIRQGYPLEGLGRPVAQRIHRPARAGLHQDRVVLQHLGVGKPVVNGHPQEELRRRPASRNLLDDVLVPPRAKQSETG